MNLGTIWLGIRGDTKPVRKNLDDLKRTATQNASTIEQKTTRSLSNLTKYWKLYALAATAALGLVAKTFISAASTAEGYAVRLKVLLGSVKEGNKLFKAMGGFASTVSFQYEEIMGGATALAGVMKGGVGEIKKWMPMIADLAAASGMGIQETTGQVIRMYSAGAAAADMFRERGILAMMGFKSGVKYSTEETQKIMFEAWNSSTSKFKDASKELAKTWSGLMSMLKDAWFGFRTAVMEAGVFVFMKAAVSLVLDKINKLKKEGRLDEWAKAMADATLKMFEKIAVGTAEVIDATREIVEGIWDVLKRMWDVFKTLPSWVQTGGILGAIIAGKSGVTIMLGALILIDATKTSLEALEQVMKGTITLGEYMTANHEELTAKLKELRETGIIPTAIDMNNILIPSLQASGSATEKVTKFFEELRESIATKAWDENAVAVLKAEEAMIKARLALEANNAAMIAFASSIDIAAQKEEVLIAAFDLSIDSVKAGEKAYADHIKMVEKREDAIYKASKSAKKAEDDYTQYILGLANKAYKAHQEKIKDRGTAARDLYKDMKKFENEYFKYSDKLIQAQAQKYRDLGISEAAIAAWVTKEEEKAWRSRALASDSFFAGVKVGFKDMTDAQLTWAAHGKAMIDSVKTAWASAVSTMVNQYIAGEQKKITVAEVSKTFLVSIASSMAKKMYEAVATKIIDTIGLLLGEGAAGAGAAGSKWGGVTGALKEIGLYLTVGVGAMLAGRSLAKRFAGGGWIESHPGGGMIRQGSGVADDVFLKSTPGVNHWGMGGEFVVNKQSTAKHGQLLEAINRDRGMMTGGYIDRGYAEGSSLTEAKWKSVADMLLIGSGFSFLHGLYKGGGIYTAIVEAIKFFAVAVPAMFAGKLLSNKFMAGGGMIDVGHGWGLPDIIPKPIRKIIPKPFRKDIDLLTDPKSIWEEIKLDLRTPLKQLAIDLVTPKKYYTDVGPAISIIKDYAKTKVQERLPFKIPGFDQGGVLPHTGLYYGHGGERVLSKEDTKSYEAKTPGSPGQFNIVINLDGRQIFQGLFDATRDGTARIHPKAIEGYLERVGIAQ